ncbi:hypothetical protein GGR50DRAFT_680298 [Xylaria sp. CBS 124048]|nr:hypothetical protein GGR50DRAFT_680298 [Xylaria sp. CBS 124048]
MAKRGLMFVESRVRDPHKTSDELYNRFYNEEHLPHVIASGQPKIALRYKNVKEGAAVPYIALYPVDDTSAIPSPTALEQMKYSSKSRILQCDSYHELIYFNLRPYEKVQTYEARGRDGGENGVRRGRTMCCIAIEPAEGHNGDFDAWYRNEHLGRLGIYEEFLRCTCYRRTDGQSPRFLMLYEFDCAPEDFHVDRMTEAWATERGLKILNEAKVYQQDVFALIQVQGDMRLQL